MRHLIVCPIRPFAGEFTDILDQQNALSQATFQNGALVKSGSVEPVGTVISSGEASRSSSRIKLIDIQESESPKQHGGQPLLILENLTLSTPQYSMTLFKDLSLVVEKGENLLVSSRLISLSPHTHVRTNTWIEVLFM